MTPGDTGLSIDGFMSNDYGSIPEIQHAVLLHFWGLTINTIRTEKEGERHERNSRIRQCPLSMFVSEKF